MRTTNTDHTAVTIYTLPNCMQCEMTKKRFDALDVPYRTVDLETDLQSRARFKEEGLQGAPIVETATGEHWTGFRLDRIKSVAAQQRSARSTAVVSRCFSATRDTTTRPAAPPEARRTEQGAANSSVSEVSR